MLGLGDQNVPFLLEFGSPRNQLLTAASSMSYSLMCQSIARFYAWAFAQELRRSFSAQELLDAPTPAYKGRTGDSRRSEPAVNTTREAREIWQLAMESVRSSGCDPHEAAGHAIYDMLALEAQGNPVTYVRQLGSRAGILVPPAGCSTDQTLPPQTGRARSVGERSC